MSIKEIGSEFWYEEPDIKTQQNYLFGKEFTFLLSGRTAIDLIIEDIKIEREIRSIYFPSYYCNSMIQPFISRGIDVVFYQVSISAEGTFEFEIKDNNCDAILIINYFGFFNEDIRKLIDYANEKNQVIIEDATHSFFSDNPNPSFYHYKFASLRKWLPIMDGAVAMKSNGSFNIKIKEHTNNSFLEERVRAFSLKRDYIINGLGEKSQFLKSYSNANSILEKDYSEYQMSTESFRILTHYDLNTMCIKRKGNGSFLIDQLSKIPEITIIKRGLHIHETPLFIPIFLENTVRNQLKEYLIKQHIYCPAHWPISSLQNNSMIYQKELSIVCDQRYGISEMEKINYHIQKFLS